MNTEFFGITYLETDDFRLSANLFGAGMAMCDYADNDEGNLKLGNALAAASRMIDAFCGKTFTPDDGTETHKFDRDNWRFSVNNPPVTSISQCRLRYASDGYLQIAPDRIYINNQESYCEILRAFDGAFVILDLLGTELAEPQVEITYKSAQSIPANVRLACGYQTAHLINTGFVDSTLPTNFGKLDIGGISVNNKKGYRNAEEMKSGSMSAEASRLLSTEIRFSAA